MQEQVAEGPAGCRAEFGFQFRRVDLCQPHDVRADNDRIPIDNPNDSSGKAVRVVAAGPPACPDTRRSRGLRRVYDAFDATGEGSRDGRGGRRENYEDDVSYPLHPLPGGRSCSS